MNFARLNHILIAPTKHERDRVRSTRLGRIFIAMFGAWEMFSTEGRFVLLFWLLAGLFVDMVTCVYQLWSVVTGALVAGLVMRRFFSVRELSVRVVAPRRVTVCEEASVTLRVHNGSAQHHRSIRIQGPFLPWDGSYLGAAPSLPALAPGESDERSLRMRFSARGEHHLDPFVIRALVPLGLTMGAGVQTDGTRLLVVPRVAVVSELRLPNATRYQPGGVVLASRTGESRELVGVRPYRAGDPIRDIHARTWARSGRPAVREYEQEYFTRIGVVVDTERKRVGERSFEAALSLAAGVVAHLTRGEALIDLLVAGDQVLTLTLGRSLGFLEQALDMLACVQPAGALDLPVMQRRLRAHLERLSCVVFVALCWDEPRAAFADWVRSQGVGCRVLLIEDATRSTETTPPELRRVSVRAIETNQGLIV